MTQMNSSTEKPFASLRREHLVTARPGTGSRGKAAAAARRRAVERRQLTVVFCDLIGSTALFERLDPEEVGETMRGFRQCCAEQIEAAGGFVAQFQGDGVIGYFGYTEANESNAERAVRAGLDMSGWCRSCPRTAPRSFRRGSGLQRAWRLSAIRMAAGPGWNRAPWARRCISRRVCSRLRCPIRSLSHTARGA